MKAPVFTQFIGTSVLGLTLFASSVTWAIPPRQHSVSGVVTSISENAHTFTVAPDNGSEPQVFVWKDYSRFIHRSSRVCAGALKPGLAVKIYYRRKIGQFVPYWAYLQNGAETRCTTGECCKTGDKK